MAAITLEDVTHELKTVNGTLTIMNSNSNFAIEYLDMIHDTLRDKFETLTNAVIGDALAKLEATREQNQFNERMLDALEDLKNKPEKPEKKEDEGGISWGSIAGIGLALAATLGTIVGGLRGWYKGWKKFSLKSLTFIEKMGGRFLNALKNFKMTAWIGKIGEGFRLGYIFLKSFVIELGKALKGLGGDVVRLMTDAFKNVANIFKNLGSTKAGKFLTKGIQAFKNFMDATAKFFRPLVYTFKKLTGSFGKSSQMISKITGYFAKFSKAFKFFGALASKIAWPITVIIATVQGAIAAWNKEGGFINKIGAFFGGLMGTLVGGILDLGKSIISWVLGAIGFDKAEAFLDSFSFEEMINNLIQSVFDTVDGVIDWFAETFTWDNMKKQWENLTDWVGSLGDSLFGWWEDFKTWMDETFSWKNIYMSLPQTVRKGLKFLGMAPDMSEDGDVSESNMNDGDNVGNTAKVEYIGSEDNMDDMTNTEPVFEGFQFVPPKTSEDLDKAEAENANLGGNGKTAITIVNNNNVNNSRIDNSSTGVTQISAGGVKKPAYNPDPIGGPVYGP